MSMRSIASKYRPCAIVTPITPNRASGRMSPRRIERTASSTAGRSSSAAPYERHAASTLGATPASKLIFEAIPVVANRTEPSPT
jgi:hypothetical protein